MDVRAALKPGGLFLYCDHHARAEEGELNALYLTREKQFEALGAAGFRNVELVLGENGMALYSARR